MDTKNKLVKENIEFQRGQTAKKAVGVGREGAGIPSKEELKDYFYSELWDVTEKFINDDILGMLFMQFDNIDTEEVKEALCEMSEEALDTWKQTTDYKY